MDYTGFKGDSDVELVNGLMGSTIREQEVTLRIRATVAHHLQP